ncbi:FHA domain-containing protein [Pendulispora albinea]|uniref:FHA domain-containing protein n=1 Tax=Pendulispora albinea TaxID=2741071 RepID=A0ABZ2M970_9BACT
MQIASNRALDVSTLRVRAGALTREQFVRDYPGYYLVVTPNPESLNIGYRTVAMSVASARKSEGAPPATFDIVPIAKAPHNPYPDRVSIGRATNCDIVFRDASVSKLHAHFHDFRAGAPGPLRVVDLGSSNGTRVNHVILEPQHPVVLEPGDTLQLGGVKARVADGDALYEFLR